MSVSAVPQITLRLIRRFGYSDSLPAYRHALIRACEDFPPPYGMAQYGDIYREAAVHGGWLAVSMITNAEREGDGAQRLWSLSACTSDPTIAGQIKQHAIDESKHSKTYLRMVDLVFPGAVDSDFRKELDSLSPDYSHSLTPVAKIGSAFSHPITLDDLIQMNIAEIRTTIHHLLQRPMLRAHCPAESEPRLVRLQQALLSDELKHVGYTANLIEAHAREVGTDAVVELFRQRMLDFNEVTRAELEDRVFDVS